MIVDASCGQAWWPVIGGEAPFVSIDGVHAACKYIIDGPDADERPSDAALAQCAPLCAAGAASTASPGRLQQHRDYNQLCKTDITVSHTVTSTPADGEEGPFNERFKAKLVRFAFVTCSQVYQLDVAVAPSMKRSSISCSADQQTCVPRAMHADCHITSHSWGAPVDDTASTARICCCVQTHLVCFHCGKAVKGSQTQCMSCKWAWFCSPQCQKAAWPVHKAICKMAKAAAQGIPPGCKGPIPGQSWSLAVLADCLQVRATSEECLGWLSMLIPRSLWCTYRVRYSAHTAFKRSCIGHAARVCVEKHKPTLQSTGHVKRLASLQCFVHV